MTILPANNRNWTEADQQQAFDEGWGVFDIDSTGYLEIQRLDEAEIFSSDEEARSYVYNETSTLHALAISIVKTSQKHRKRPQA